MKKTLIALSLIAGTSLAAQTNWGVDNGHSNVSFAIDHLTIVSMKGNFEEFDGSVKSKNADFSDAEIAFTIKTASINTEDENRDKHLKSDDFFSVEKYPEITFKSTSFKKVKDKKYKMKGDLTLKGITKPVEFDVVYNGTVKDPWGNEKAGFKINTLINRGDYGITWNAPLENGGFLLGEKVEISSDLELLKKKE